MIVFGSAQTRQYGIYSGTHKKTGCEVRLLINLETAQHGRRVLLSDEQKLLVRERKKGFAKNTKLDFMSI